MKGRIIQGNQESRTIIPGRGGITKPPLPLMLRRSVKKKDHFFKNFPCDLLPEILKRLPLNSLCRFKCVSKSWCSMIIQNFLHSPRPSIVVQLCQPKNSRLPHPISLFSIDGQTGIAQPRWITSAEYFTCSRIPVNGLFCFVVDDQVDGATLAGMDHLYGSTLAVCNPATKEKPLLLPQNNQYFSSKKSPYDLGFDPVSKQYKVLGRRDFPSCTIHTLGTSSWRPFKTTALQGCTRPYLWSVCIDGIMYWSDSLANMVISFHVADESFKAFEGPPTVVPPLIQGPCEVEGCLCFFHVHHFMQKVDLWMLKHHSNGDTHWVMMASITLPSSKVHYEIPYSTRKGEIVVARASGTERALYLYSFLTQRVDKLQVVGLEPEFITANYVDNFTSLKDL